MAMKSTSFLSARATVRQHATDEKRTNPARSPSSPLTTARSVTLYSVKGRTESLNSAGARGFCAAGPPVTCLQPLARAC